MKSILSIGLINLLVLGHLFIHVVSRDFDFFYFVQQWPGSYCDTKQKCCYPTTGKPVADFGIHGLWPNYKDGTYPSNCDPNNPFDKSQISDLIGRLQRNWPTLACPSSNGLKFWEHEWEKHGTCSKSVFDQHAYFQTSLSLQSRVNILSLLQAAGVEPNGTFYRLDYVREAIKYGLGHNPWFECNVDSDGNNQLYQVYMCIDASGSRLIECPIYPKGRACGSRIQFPAF